MRRLQQTRFPQGCSQDCPRLRKRAHRSGCNQGCVETCEPARSPPSLPKQGAAMSLRLQPKLPPLGQQKTQTNPTPLFCAPIDRQVTPDPTTTGPHPNSPTTPTAPRPHAAHPAQSARDALPNLTTGLAPLGLLPNQHWTPDLSPELHFPGNKQESPKLGKPRPLPTTRCKQHPALTQPSRNPIKPQHIRTSARHRVSTQTTSPTLRLRLPLRPTRDARP